VFPGERIARLVPTLPPNPGRGLDGKEMPPPASPHEVRMIAGEGCTLDADETVAVAQVYGQAFVEKNEVFVDEGIRLELDGFVCRMDVVPSRANGEPLTEEDLYSVISSVGVQDRYISRESLKKALGTARRIGGLVADQIVAQGVAPIGGADGEFRLLVKAETQAGAIGPRDRIDFRERSLLHQVSENERVAEIALPTEGTPGQGVTGESIPAEPGDPVPVSFGEGVRQETDGLYANKDGIVLVDNGRIEVVSAFLLDGNVDYDSGNLVVDSGSIMIRGSVLAGFLVESPERVEIEDSVEGGVIRAGHEVFVKNAIIGGEVESGGDLHAKRTLDATLRCEGDLYLDREVRFPSFVLNNPDLECLRLHAT